MHFSVYTSSFKNLFICYIKKLLLFIIIRVFIIFSSINASADRNHSRFNVGLHHHQPTSSSHRKKHVFISVFPFFLYKYKYGVFYFTIITIYFYYDFTNICAFILFDVLSSFYRTNIRQ